MNHQTADPKAHASVFLFFSTAHFFKTNKRSASRVPTKDKLNKRAILASRTNGLTCPDISGFGVARHPFSYRDRPFVKPKEPFNANAQQKQITKIF